MSRFVLSLGAAFVAVMSITMTAAAQTPAPAASQAAQRPATPPPAGLTTNTPGFEVTGGYQLLHVPDLTLPIGLNIDGAWNFGSFAAAGEVGWAFKSDDNDGVDTNLHLWHVGVGPRWEARGSKVWPFAQVLVGAVHARSSATIAGVDVDASDTKFMVQPGVGVNVVAGDGWGVVGQVDYRRVFLDEDEDGESGENHVRVFLGIRMILD